MKNSPRKRNPRPEIVISGVKCSTDSIDQISDEVLMAEGRVYGGGLHKLESKELGNALPEKVLEVLPNLIIN